MVVGGTKDQGEIAPLSEAMSQQRPSGRDWKLVDRKEESEVVVENRGQGMMRYVVNGE